MTKSRSYNDIIELPHHVSPKRPQMSMSDRAAQFSPFAALVGYGDAIKETGRVIGKRKEMDEDTSNDLNMKLGILSEHLSSEPCVSISYFKPDERKAGGEYIEVTGIVKKINIFERIITMQDGAIIPMDDIIAVFGDIFASME